MKDEFGVIYGINGPILSVSGYDGYKMSEMVLIGEEGLIGEVIGIEAEKSTIQVFEDTSGLRPGAPVFSTGGQLSVSLGPGMIGNIFDGIQRPLKSIEKDSGVFISRGVHVDSLDMDRKWSLQTLASEGDQAFPGMVIAQVKETESIICRIMIPPDIRGVIKSIVPDGSYTLRDAIAVVEVSASAAQEFEPLPDSPSKFELKEIRMVQKWPIRVPRPVDKRKIVDRPLITGQRIIDTLFPIGKGGMAAIPGGFGTGKTMTQHQLAKWSDADIIVYIGCGERGNEMTEVLEDFSELKDPRTKRALMDRTILIANTSNMPVAAREASIYTGIAIAEFYRDMGYHVAIMADSTSRWAEALRELSGRLEEMPAEEGFPAYLASRLSSFYERAGSVTTLSGADASVTIIGAVSPQGADFSEPVTQNTKRFVRVFWALDRSLAYARHFPAIQWLTSYSEYLDDMEEWYRDNVGSDFLAHRQSILKILYEESELMEIVKLIGSDVLPDSQRLTLEMARVIRLGFVQQNAYHMFDTYVPFAKQLKMMEIILHLNETCWKLVKLGISMNVLKSEDIFERVIAIKYNVGNDDLDKLEGYISDIDDFYGRLYEKNA
ncbi:MAG: V-type ATP synthase subunit A [Clostridiales bacterium]|jgi:V/A-type H+-transporting ATPase subunit A|nr:V-type ATP synthase subunit A [Clostridiales bacterium]